MIFVPPLSASCIAWAKFWSSGELVSNTTSNTITMACTTTGSAPLGPSGSGVLYNVKFRPPAIGGSGAGITYSSFTGSGGQVSYGASTMTDNLANFPTPNGLAGKTIVVGSFTGVIASSTMTTITLTLPWISQPSDLAQYVIATMTDSTKSFAPNSLAGQTIVSGSNSAVVYSNTATTVTLKTPWTPATPATGASYNLFSAVVNTQATISQTSALTDVQGASVDHTDGSVTILFSRCADVSGNGAVSLGDPLQILSFVGKTSSDPNWSTYSKNDMNQNNAIALSDVLYALDEVGQLCIYTP